MPNLKALGEPSLLTIISLSWECLRFEFVLKLGTRSKGLGTERSEETGETIRRIGVCAQQRNRGPT